MFIGNGNCFILLGLYVFTIRSYSSNCPSIKPPVSMGGISTLTCFKQDSFLPQLRICSALHFGYTKVAIIFKTLPSKIFNKHLHVFTLHRNGVHQAIGWP